eukprot:scaffold5784_cov47-Phaeocystis_antarctica.AAC.1
MGRGEVAWLGSRWEQVGAHAQRRARREVERREARAGGEGGGEGLVCEGGAAAPVRRAAQPQRRQLRARQPEVCELGAPG